MQSTSNNEKEKILIISSWHIYPKTSGCQTYIDSIIKRLSEEKIITIISPRNTKKSNNKNIIYKDFFSSSKNKFYSFKVLKEILKESKNNDKILFDFPWFPFIYGRFLKKKWEYRAHNIEYLRFRSYKKWFWPIIYLIEKYVFSKASKIRFISKKDLNFAKRKFKLKGANCIYEPYVPDPSIFYKTSKYKKEIRKKLNLKNKEKFYLFFGKLDYKPNLNAIKRIKKELIPQLNKKKEKYKIIICGKNAPEIYDPNIIFTGFVENIEKYIQSCDYFLDIVSEGGGTQTKLEEVKACKTRIFSL